MEISENEKRRAVNLIWNAARDYDFDPDFKVYDAEGRAELYWNCIIGAVHRHYDWDKTAAMFRSFRGTENQLTYENLAWLGLENAAFLREKRDRPALPYLREHFARTVAALPAEAEPPVQDRLVRAHFLRALGQPAPLSPEDAAMLDALEFGPEMDTDQMIARTLTLFTDRLGYHPAGEGQKEEPEKERGFFLPFFRWGRKGKGAPPELRPVRSFGIGLGEHTDEYGGEALDQSHIRVSFAKYTAQTDEGLRRYIVSCFGKPMYDQRQTRELERSYCTGNHRDCHLHFTRGEPDELPVKGYAVVQRRAAEEQEKRNRAYYEENLARNRAAIDRLTSRLRNTMLTQLETTAVKSSAGRLVGGRIWRGVYLNDNKIFEKDLRGDAGNLSVDILLDASTSQIHRQEIVSTQGYLIAESLTRCGLPVRVYSFFSMSGYTVMNLFRDYGETGDNANIFRYVTNGCNRDGLAIRLAVGQLKKTDCEHKLLIILSDAKPNDVLKVETGRNIYRDYTEDTGVADTAAEVHQARLNDISVVCVFTGNDEDLPAARKIYGQDFSRIRHLSQFADTVGALIQNQIRNL